MDCLWIKVSPSFSKGITTINQLDNSKFEQFLRHIVVKLKLQDKEIFSEDERQKLCKIFKIEEDQLLLSIKSIIYLFKRLLKFILMPADLKKDLNKMGLSNEKAEFVVKVWSTETRATLDDFKTDMVDRNMHSLNISWKLNAELSSDYRKKCKLPKVYLHLKDKKEESEIELTHPELYSVFLQFESIQNELDIII